jgi:hypothetical protein
MLLPTGFRNAELRSLVPQAQGLATNEYSAGQMTYDLRHLRGHALIERQPRSHRYRLTQRDCGFACSLPRSTIG